MKWPWRKKEAPLTAGEAFVLREFPEAINLAAKDWKGFDNLFKYHEIQKDYSLSQRLIAFLAGPICAELESKFPRIGELGSDADAKTGQQGHASVICELIVMEAVVSLGEHSRIEVRAARSS
jgi:hypothetical protein